jgi:hypothetical protein
MKGIYMSRRLGKLLAPALLLGAITSTAFANAGSVRMTRMVVVFALKSLAPN